MLNLVFLILLFVSQWVHSFIASVDLECPLLQYYVSFAWPIHCLWELAYFLCSQFYPLFLYFLCPLLLLRSKSFSYMMIDRLISGLIHELVCERRNHSMVLGEVVGITFISKLCKYLFVNFESGLLLLPDLFSVLLNFIDLILHRLDLIAYRILLGLKVWEILIIGQVINEVGRRNGVIELVGILSKGRVKDLKGAVHVWRIFKFSIVIHAIFNFIDNEPRSL